jgi:homocysteine S-methyltransferase
MLPLGRQQLILTEGSVFELLRREEGIDLDPEIAHASLVYDGASRRRLAAVHDGYLRIAERHGLPAIAWADTWRASGERIARSRFAGLDVNGENVRFIRELAAQRSGEVIVGALTGPKGDAYDPREAPSFDDALRYHEPQIAGLAVSRPDLIVAATLPSFEEARAIARLLAESAIPFLISAVVRRDGTMLDGTPLATAIARIDDESRPLGFSINCTHSSAARDALRRLDDRATRRVIAFQANTSARAPEDLDGLGHLETEEPEVFAASLAELARTTSLRILGGCCGTDERHIEALAARLVRAAGVA